VEAKCGSEEWKRSVEVWCGSEVWKRSVEAKCGSEEWKRSVEAKSGSEVWKRSVEAKCGSEEWKCGGMFWIYILFFYFSVYLLTGLEKYKKNKWIRKKYFIY